MQINDRNAVVSAGHKTCFVKRFQSFTESMQKQKNIWKIQSLHLDSSTQSLFCPRRTTRSRSDGLLPDEENKNNHWAHLVFKFQTSARSQCSQLLAPTLKSVCVVCEGFMSERSSHVNKDFFFPASKNIDVITVHLYLFKLVKLWTNK